MLQRSFKNIFLRRAACAACLSVLGGVFVSGCGGGGGVNSNPGAPGITRYTFANYQTTTPLPGGGAAAYNFRVDSDSRLRGSLTANGNTGTLNGLVNDQNNGSFTATGSYTENGTSIPVSLSGTIPQRTDGSGGTANWSVNGVTSSSSFTVTPVLDNNTAF